MATVDEVRNIVKKLCEKYGARCIEVREPLIVMSWDFDLDAVVYNPENILVTFQFSSEKVKALGIEKYIDEMIEHELAHREQIREMERKCPDKLRKLLKFAREWVGLTSIVLDHELYAKRMPSEKKVVTEAMRESFHEVFDPVIFLIKFEEGYIGRKRELFSEYLRDLGLLSYEDLEKYGLTGTIHEEIWRDLMTVVEKVKGDICSAPDEIEKFLRKWWYRR